jgi:hypothetical protein
MPRSLWLVLWMAGFLTLSSTAAQSNASSIGPGQMLPQFSGQSLTGKSLELPTAAGGKPAVVIFSFSRAAGNDARSWNEHLSRDFPQAVPSYTIIELESVPRLIRGMVVSSIKGSMALTLQERTLVLYHDETVWKERLAVSDDSRSYVVLLNPDGRVQWRSDGPFTEPSYARLKDQLK